MVLLPFCKSSANWSYFIVKVRTFVIPPKTTGIMHLTFLFQKSYCTNENSVFYSINFKLICMGLKRLSEQILHYKLKTIHWLPIRYGSSHLINYPNILVMLLIKAVFSLSLSSFGHHQTSFGSCSEICMSL